MQQLKMSHNYELIWTISQDILSEDSKVQKKSVYTIQSFSNEDGEMRKHPGIV